MRSINAVRTQEVVQLQPLRDPGLRLIASISARYSLVDLTVEEPEIEEVIRAIYMDKAERLKE